MKKLRVMTYNIHKGFGSLRGQYILSEVREAIRNSSADLVLLQEVIGRNNKIKSIGVETDLESQFEYLADQVWSHHSYGRNAVYDSGHHGNAILSLHPIDTTFNTDISTNRFERRGFLYAKISNVVHVVNLHLDLFESGRLKQISKLIDFVTSLPVEEPLIIGGDFNDWTSEISHKLMLDVGLVEAHFEFHGQFAKSFPSFFPFLQLDRLFYRGMFLEQVECYSDKKWRRLSDHLPIVADFVF